MDGWKSTFKRLHRSLSSNNARKEAPTVRVNNHQQPRQRGVQQELFEEDSPLPPIRLNGYIVTTKDRLLTLEICEEIRTLIPRRIQLYTDWHLLYSLEQHGASLHSLYEHVKPQEQTSSRVGYLLVIKDKKGGIFGAYANEPFRPTESRRYYGNGECVLWKVHKVPDLMIGGAGGGEGGPEEHNGQDGQQQERKLQFRGYTYTGINEFCIYCTGAFLSMGAGNGQYGLWCDEGLVNGVSGRCLTFGNDVLSREGHKFHIIGLEVWRIG
ncbi:Oxr1p Ecym_2215 [Eremothecium cymbalariae DBVPG|uniref:Oxidation resistance protein 1 n=1 Tax=Eremothecium cymbalariae (strain CBS 270.75 / DBVPG 7215 / KCTC 17166 / NRRL Y-17582) TaxID=931890 RepID=G8JP59_ERECY|nr:Hypothetical protein Ecym_2215 [Eremothecium cymbalariae DBVPG\